MNAELWRVVCGDVTSDREWDTRSEADEWLAYWHVGFGCGRSHDVRHHPAEAQP